MCITISLPSLLVRDQIYSSITIFEFFGKRKNTSRREKPRRAALLWFTLNIRTGDSNIGISSLAIAVQKLDSWRYLFSAFSLEQCRRHDGLQARDPSFVHPPHGGSPIPTMHDARWVMSYFLQQIKVAERNRPKGYVRNMVKVPPRDGEVLRVRKEGAPVSGTFDVLSPSDNRTRTGSGNMMNVCSESPTTYLGAKEREYYVTETRDAAQFIEPSGTKNHSGYNISSRASEQLKPASGAARKVPVPDFCAVLPQEDNEIISQAWLWPRVSQFFPSQRRHRYRNRNRELWHLRSAVACGSSAYKPGSVGVDWVGPVAVRSGAAFAASEMGLNRTMLFIGDGSLQLTVQELSSMIRHGLKPIIFVLNNAGYEIERVIHGPERKYNDVANWDYAGLLRVLGDKAGTVSRSYTVRTKDELSNLLDTAEFAEADRYR
ncbi:hypothetical protein B0H14DRAFT_3665808 [Mycena olivaceomarginata]|nr:hypothetical protein B0H14DRAFT_3665808 [Mycena olivaceomarginata]